MRLLLTFIILFFSLSVFAQRNAPVIKGQSELSTNENEPITIQFGDLKVTDRDDWFLSLGFYDATLRR